MIRSTSNNPLSFTHREVKKRERKADPNSSQKHQNRKINKKLHANPLFNAFPSPVKSPPKLTKFHITESLHEGFAEFEELLRGKHPLWSGDNDPRNSKKKKKKIGTTEVRAERRD